MTRYEYEKLPIDERLNLCERGIGLMIHQLSEKTEQATTRQKLNQSEAKKHWKDGRIASALDMDAQARGDELMVRELSDLKFRFKCWQAHSSTPSDQLPFPTDSHDHTR